LKQGLIEAVSLTLPAVIKSRVDAEIK
jgi:hypothetical protein